MFFTQRLPHEDNMHSDNLSAEARILRMVKKVLTDVAKDTYTPPGMKHPLSEDTINNIRECFNLISAREAELNGDSTSRPRYIDEPQDTVVVAFDKGSQKKKD